MQVRMDYNKLHPLQLSFGLEVHGRFFQTSTEKVLWAQQKVSGWFLTLTFLTESVANVIREFFNIMCYQFLHHYISLSKPEI